MIRVDVVVAGAGPAGSATAMHLAARGFRVALLDRAAFPRAKPCAEYLGPGAVRLLGRLGALEELSAGPHAVIRGMRVVCRGAAFEGRFPPDQDGLGLSRRDLDATLVRGAVARGVAVYEHTTVEALDLEDPRAITVAAHTPAGLLRFRARLLVGADGLNSRVARRLGLTRRSGPRRLALVTHAAGVSGMGEVGEMHVGDTGYVGLAPLGNGVTNVALVMDRSRAAESGTPEVLLERELAQHPEVRARLEAATRVDRVRAVGPFATRARRATAHRVVLAGDAADFHDPFTGEGVYAALRGAELIAQVVTPALERDRLSARDLAVYDAARGRAFAGKWAFERLVSWAISRPALFCRVARFLAVRPRLADLVVRRTGHVAA